MFKFNRVCFPTAGAGVVRRPIKVGTLLLGFAAAMVGDRVAQAQLFGTVSFSQVSAPNAAYGATDINSCSVDLNNLVTATVGGNTFQFAAYYDNSGDINIARRSLGSSAWTSVDTHINIVTPTDGNVTAASLLGDDHNTIALAVDSTGDLNMSFGMHNVELNYEISNASVMGNVASFQALSFTQQTPANAPTLFPNNSATTNEATYPDFYNIPGSNDLLFAYRNGGAGGGSGNGDEYFNVYDPTTKTWTNELVINGELTSVNAYLNNLVYDSNGNLLMSWTWRATPNWQTNSNIMFAQSPDNGTTWFKQGGTAKYDLPIIQNTVGHNGPNGDAKSVAQVVETIPENDSFINQTSMTVDHNNNPFIATYLTPGWNVNTNSGNPNRQYVLEYYTGTAWKTSQVSDRTSDTSIDTSGNDVRDLGRPLVMIDSEGRVLVVTRSEDTGLGDFDNNLGLNKNNIVVYWNTVASLDSATPAAWQSISLDSADMGESEPTYDSTLWNQDNILDLMYEPTDVGGSSAPQTLQVLEWNEQAYFAATVPEPTTLGLIAGAVGLGLVRRPRRSRIESK
jgi:BNR repeat-containing family member